MKELCEKVAIVTGAGQGIGKGIALCLAKRGVKIIATGRRLEPIEQTIAEIKELGGEGYCSGNRISCRTGFLLLFRTECHCRWCKFNYAVIHTEEEFAHSDQNRKIGQKRLRFRFCFRINAKENSF